MGAGVWGLRLTARPPARVGDSKPQPLSPPAEVPNLVEQTYAVLSGLCPKPGPSESVTMKNVSMVCYKALVTGTAMLRSFLVRV